VKHARGPFIRICCLASLGKVFSGILVVMIEAWLSSAVYNEVNEALFLYED